MTIRIKTSGEPMDKTLARKMRAAISAVGPIIVGMIQRRTAKGQSYKGASLADYKASYRDWLAEGGELAKVDLTLTGSYLADIKVLQETITETSASVLVGPGTGTSPQVTAKDGHMHQTGRRSPPHNILGRYLDQGTPRMRARPHLGLTKDEASRLAKRIAALLVQ